MKVPQYRVLPGGRRVRDYPADAAAAEVIAYAEQSEAAADLALAEEEKRAKPRKSVMEALTDDDTVG